MASRPAADRHQRRGRASAQPDFEASSGILLARHVTRSTAAAEARRQPNRKPDAERVVDGYQVRNVSTRLSTQVYTPFGRWAGRADFFSIFSQVRGDEFRKVGFVIPSNRRAPSGRRIPSSTRSPAKTSAVGGVLRDIAFAPAGAATSPGPAGPAGGGGRERRSGGRPGPGRRGPGPREREWNLAYPFTSRGATFYAEGALRVFERREQPRRNSLSHPGPPATML